MYWWKRRGNSAVERDGTHFKQVEEAQANESATEIGINDEERLTEVFTFPEE
jgi:hypothetical protein